MLTIKTHLDEALLDVPAHRLYQVLPGPVLFHIKGKKAAPLFLSVLLHGNENTGWEVVKRLLNKYRGETLPRSLSIFVGNIKAARYRKRKLTTQPDYNRVWSGGDSEEADMMRQVVAEMKKHKVFASIDIHNNNGLNPHYACINRLDPRFLTLARQFSRMVIYFIRPSGVQSAAFAKLCPAVTLECGQPGDEYGIQLATNFADHVLQLEKLTPEPEIENTIDLYHTIGIVKVPDDIGITFEQEDADIQFINGIEKLNFEEIPPQTTIGHLTRTIARPFLVLDEDGNDVFDRYFRIDDDSIKTLTSVMPAMLTTRIPIIRQDCFCYLMEKYDINQGEKELHGEQPVWS